MLEHDEPGGECDEEDGAADGDGPEGLVFAEVDRALLEFVVAFFLGEEPEKGGSAVGLDAEADVAAAGPQERGGEYDASEGDGDGACGLHGAPPIVVESDLRCPEV